MSHTPGPWRISSGFEIVAADNRLVAAVHTNSRMDSREESANRRLIAAAPELLAMLKEFAPKTSLVLSDSKGQRVLDLIAKVEGTTTP